MRTIVDAAHFAGRSSQWRAGSPWVLAHPGFPRIRTCALKRMRQLLLSHADLARKLDAMEKKYDAQFKVVFDAIRGLLAPPPQSKVGRIGFATENEGRFDSSSELIRLSLH